MNSVARRDRRWRWWLLALALLITAGPMIGRWRPLTATERALVGTWSNSTPGAKLQFSLDRRVDGQFYLKADRLGEPFALFVNGGTWCVVGDSMRIHRPRSVLSDIRQSGFRSFLQGLATDSHTDVLTLRIEGPDQIAIEGQSLRRLPEPGR